MDWMNEESWFISWRGSSPKNPHWPWVHPATCSIGLGVERTGYEADHSPDPLWRLRMSGAIPPLPPYTVMVCSRQPLLNRKVLVTQRYSNLFH